MFRLITVTPIEERILARAGDKAELEALVIEAGEFGGDEVVQVRASRGGGGASGRHASRPACG